MTTLGIMSTNTARIQNAAVERVLLPSALDADDCVAAWDFYTLLDGSGNGWDLTLGPKVTRNDAGAIVIGDTGTSSYATCDGLPLPSQFSFVASLKFGASMGTVFGNYTTDGSTETGLRIYSASGAVLAKIGNDTGRASLTTSLADWMEIGVTFDGETIAVYTDVASANGTEASALGSEPCRFGRSVLGSGPAAGGTIIACAALYNTARSASSVRERMAAAKAKRLGDLWA